jgi:Ca2+-binding EF-hand superfamily protein
MRGLEIPAIP